MPRRARSIAKPPTLFDANPCYFQEPELPTDWLKVLRKEFASPYYQSLHTFLEEERQQGEVYPAPEDVFRAFKLTPLCTVRVVILGQDPYHDIGQAHGLSFSVQPGVVPPPSLKNIFRELQDDCCVPFPTTGYLAPWAEQGVLLLNTVLTVRAHLAASHRKKGWELFTDAVIQAVNVDRPHVAFILWGAQAGTKAERIDRQHHLVISSAHPSPLSARNGFFGSRPFSRTNQFLIDRGFPPIDWQLP